MWWHTNLVFHDLREALDLNGLRDLNGLSGDDISLYVGLLQIGGQSEDSKICDHGPCALGVFEPDDTRYAQYVYHVLPYRP